MPSNNIPKRSAKHEAKTGSTHGTLYGIGVGPGAPDLLTLRAVDTLRRVDVIFAASSPKNDYSRAFSIAAAHLPKNVEHQRLDFPMTRDPEILQQAWKKNAEIAAAVLQSGKNAAFITLGDPLVYSTFGYLMRTLQEKHPELQIEIISGITSFQEAAARSKSVLCENGENLLLISGINELDKLKVSLSLADSAIILKTYKNFADIRTAVEETGRNKEAVFASQLGFADECLIKGLDAAPDSPHYLSLLLVPPARS